jgi:pSer/pThr/pTyr-binding forkhead associated (FHA) protein
VDQSGNELTSALHLSSREIPDATPGLLEEYISSLAKEDQAVVREIQSLQGDKAMILIHRGEGKGSRFLITSDGVTIGRSTSSSIFLDDVTVSRSHAVIEKSVVDFMLRDSGSLNGTYVNGEPAAEVVLNSGDEIQIGKFHLLFVSGASNKNK